MSEEKDLDSEKAAQDELEKQMAEGYKALAEEHRQFAIMVFPLAIEVLPEWK